MYQIMSARLTHLVQDIENPPFGQARSTGLLPVPTAPPNSRDAQSGIAGQQRWSPRRSTSRRNLSRLARSEQPGLIKVRGRTITVVDAARLQFAA
jgi:hypothetical protein